MFCHDERNTKMLCPFCSHTETKVLESRQTASEMRRRRECHDCQNRFTTYETAVFKLSVIKKDGRIQPFTSEKIEQSVYKACGKVDEKEISNIAQKVERSVLLKKKHMIPSKLIGKHVMRELKKFDKIAYFRYASVYKSIEDPKVLEKELQQIV